MSDVDNGRGMRVWGQVAYGASLYLPLNFFFKPNILKN